MNKTTSLASLALALAVLITGCSSGDDSPFTEGGGSSTNIIASTNFGVAASELNPQVLEFAAGSVSSGSPTANIANLVAGWSPVSSELTVTAADNNGALVSSGTVYFATEYGILSAPSCQLTDGRCSITWESIADRSKLMIDASTIDIINEITVWTYGIEGFIDLDGDDRLSNSEVFFDTESPYLDRNDNDTYDPTIDDTIINSAYSPPNGLYEGYNCDRSTRSDCSDASTKAIFATVGLRLNFDSTAVGVPVVAITVPANGTSAASGASITFTATVTDIEDGTIVGPNNPVAGDSIAWSSDLDGLLGTDTSITITSLTTVGTHTITLTATDSDGNVTTATVSITIT